MGDPLHLPATPHPLYCFVNSLILLPVQSTLIKSCRFSRLLGLPSPLGALVSTLFCKEAEKRQMPITLSKGENE